MARGRQIGWTSAAIGALLTLGLPALAQDALRGTAADGDATQRTAEEKLRGAESLKQIQDALQASAANKASLESELAAIGSDRTKLNAALLDAGRQAQATEDRLSRLDDRLKNLGDSEAAIRRSLDARRGVIAEILAALQRMGRRPPPAVLVRPEDVLAVIRTSMLLGAVVPELRGEAETLAGDLNELVRVRGQIAADRESLKTDLAGWAKEKQRLDALIDTRRARLSEVEQGLAAERRRAADLGSQAKSVKDLVEKMEGDLASARRAADEARAAQEREAKATQEKFAAAGIRDPAKLTLKSHFGDLRGSVLRPASGAVVRGFSQADGNGASTRGVSIATRPKAVVAAPADGWVSFAGPFRSYGRLLIINAGDGYYLLLAGMERIDVEVGQFVLAGEPVAAMGEGGTGSASASVTQASASGAAASGSSASPRDGDRSDPVLYVEFRKDGGSIDPEPWWAKGPSEKVRG